MHALSVLLILAGIVIGFMVLLAWALTPRREASHAAPVPRARRRHAAARLGRRRRLREARARAAAAARTRALS